jgi:hypothetical protein
MGDDYRLAWSNTGISDAYGYLCGRSSVDERRHIVVVGDPEHRGDTLWPGRYNNFFNFIQEPGKSNGKACSAGVGWFLGKRSCIGS